MQATGRNVTRERERGAKTGRTQSKYFVLGFVVLANIMYILQRAAINYAYGYRGIGHRMGNPFFEIVSDYP